MDIIIRLYPTGWPKGWLAGLLVLLGTATLCHAQTTLQRSTIGSAGGAASTATLRLVAVAGQPITGRASGITSGFLANTAFATDTAADEVAPLPHAFAVDAPWPNPFESFTTVRFALPEARSVRVTVYDVLGRTLAVLADGPYPPGVHTLRWTAGQVPAVSGYYFVQVEAGASVQTRPLVRIR